MSNMSPQSSILMNFLYVAFVKWELVTFLEMIRQRSLKPPKIG